MKFFSQVLKRLSSSTEVVPQAPSEGQSFEPENWRQHELQELLTFSEMLVEEHSPRSPLSLLRNASVAASSKATFNITIPLATDDEAEEFLQRLESEMKFMVANSSAEKSDLILFRRFDACGGDPVYWYGTAGHLKKTRDIDVVQRKLEQARGRRSSRASKALARARGCSGAPV